jgi:hypothetical protein
LRIRSERAKVVSSQYVTPISVMIFITTQPMNVEA